MGIIQKVKNLKTNELFMSSLVLLILMNIANVLNYLFHFSMARMLGPSDYGILAVLTSIVYLFSIPTNSIQTVVSQYTTKFRRNKEYGKIKGIMNSLFRTWFLYSLIGFGIFLIVSIFIYQPLKVSYPILAMIGLMLFGMTILPVGTGILQGSKKFKAWGWNTILNSTVKLVLSILLVYLGFGVYGPTIGLLMGILFSFIFLFPFIREVLNAQEIKEKINVFSKENLPTFIAVFMITLMYTVDILLAKYLFDSHTAGLYSVASMIGKMIFFASATIASAMFPISSEKFLEGNREKTKGVANKTALTIGILCGFSVLMLWLFPSTIITILFGKQYLEISGMIVYTALTYSLLSFLNTYLFYKISINEFSIGKSIVLSIFLLIQIGSILYFGDTLIRFIIAFLMATIINTVGTIIWIRK